ncbi:carboxymuconolactone decarboxylase family protein [Chitinophaga arvensicola]|uniref:Alkylhydroperoxidase AhpD family core domain-containing protein n=1 Tax=Chitinophaga arvensicola TaxID=29529 RepID=A0A1I0QE43_9BACT|nr:carboxymuconolactone decarboxylase family protein [Chitinophaga arvensicola]SEW25087.1 alkylhydroperoxidase AhpD family core domain-containing protein [Chitinophaga arvensicola]
MEPRINLMTTGGKAVKALSSVGAYLAKASVEASLLHLIYFRVSQINGCAFCLDMHAKDARAEGETEQRLHMIAGWREAIVYTDRERAAFAWAEALTTIHQHEVPDAVYEELRNHFSEEEIVDLTIAVTTINSYNRINIAFRTPGGHYQPGMFAAKAN